MRRKRMCELENLCRLDNAINIKNGHIPFIWGICIHEWIGGFILILECGGLA